MKLYDFLLFFSLLRYIAAKNLSDDENARSSWEMIDDMILSPEQIQILYSPSNEGRNVKTNLTLRWKNATIPYECSSDYDNNDKELIQQILLKGFAKTCIQFRPRKKTDKNYIRIVNENRCTSYVGQIGNMQLLYLKNPNCLVDRPILHEFLHAVGLHHQHAAHNRDDYLTIQWENFEPEMKKNFKKYTEKVTDFGLPYDYDSIMHYDESVFSKNGKPTMIAKKPNVTFGLFPSLSPINIMKVNKMYNCETK